MLAYIGGLVPLAIEDTSSDSTLFIYFCGSDFKPEHAANPECQEFRESFITDLRDIRPELDVFIEEGKHVIIGGGEPLLQRAPLIYLCSYIHGRNGKVEVETNGTKPNVLKELITKGIVDRLTLLIHSPFEKEKFQKSTQSATFFKSTDEIMSDIKRSIKILKDYGERCDITVRTTVVPSLIFKKEEMLEIGRDIKDLNARWELVPFSNEGVKSKKYSAIKPPSAEFLERLKDECSREYPTLRIDIEEPRNLASITEISKDRSS